MSATAVRDRHCLRPVLVRAMPSTEPPALDEQRVSELYAQAESRARHARSGLPAYVQGNLAVDFRGRGEDPQFGPQATTRSDLPDPQAWVAGILSVVLECIVGARPAHQLVRWMTPEAHEPVARKHQVAVRRGVGPLHRPHVRRVRVSEPADGVAEASAVVWHESRIRAVALRLNGVDGRWLITELQIG